MYFARTNVSDEVTLRKNGKEVGRFTVTRTAPFSIGIFVEDEERGQGYARKMMNFMLKEWTSRKEYDLSTILYIDTDASQGFWDHIGMRPNPRVEDLSAAEYGYEKCITVAEVDRYLNFESSN
jgi:GNAT superfamily N-acetyltransferase